MEGPHPNHEIVEMSDDEHNDENEVPVTGGRPVIPAPLDEDVGAGLK